MPKDLQELHDEMVQRGLITEDGGPIKCQYCGSEDLKEVNHFYDDARRVLEYEIKCNSCLDIIGHWAYGNWSPGI